MFLHPPAAAISVSGRPFLEVAQARRNGCQHPCLRCSSAARSSASSSHFVARSFDTCLLGLVGEGNKGPVITDRAARYRFSDAARVSAIGVRTVLEIERKVKKHWRERGLAWEGYVQTGGLSGRVGS